MEKKTQKKLETNIGKTKMGDRITALYPWSELLPLEKKVKYGENIAEAAGEILFIASHLEEWPALDSRHRRLREMRSI